jgi:hypothetical protein
MMRDRRSRALDPYSRLEAAQRFNVADLLTGFALDAQLPDLLDADIGRASFASITMGRSRPPRGMARFAVEHLSKPARE